MIISKELHVIGESHLSHKLEAGNIWFLAGQRNVVYSYRFFFFLGKCWHRLTRINSNLCPMLPWTGQINKTLKNPDKVKKIIKCSYFEDEMLCFHV